MNKTLIILGIFIITNTYIDKRDNNTYNTYKVEDAVWLKENLKYIFKDNSNISYNIKNYYNTFGAYYTKEAAKKACPEGFRLPTLNDYKKLFLKLEGEENNLQGKKVSIKELEKYGFLLGGITKGTNVSFTNSIGFYWTSSDTLKVNFKKPNEGKKKHLVGIHIYKDKKSDLYSIEPTYIPIESKNYSSIAINCKCVKNNY